MALLIHAALPCLLQLVLVTATLAQTDQFVYNSFLLPTNATTATTPTPSQSAPPPPPPSSALTGISEIQPDGILRLTNETSRLIGRAFYPTPLLFQTTTTTNSTKPTPPASPNASSNATTTSSPTLLNSFSASFAFAIVPEYPKLGGHGMAFLLSPSTAPPGGLPSQYLGMLNASDVGNASNHIFFVEFDTVQDFEFGDINDNHVGVNFNHMRSATAATAGYYDEQGVKQDIKLKGGDTVIAWVDYDGAAKVVNVTLAPLSVVIASGGKRPARPLISYPLDLSSVLLVDQPMFVGFSSSTGLLASSHYLFGWSFRMNGPAPALSFSDLPSLPRPPSQNRSNNPNVALVAAVSVCSFFILIVSVAAAVYSYRWYRRKAADDAVEPWELQYGPHRYNYSELSKATKGFRDRDHLLGVGGFGKVYKGVLPTTNAAVAVKRVSNESKQGIREFVAEIATIGRLRHRNLVQLRGWCRRRGDLMLVYDYMPNGSLDKHLFTDDGWGGTSDNLPPLPPPVLLTWSQRYKILRGVASALLYLHEEWDHVVVHRDVKASNVLLDADMSGRLGDFGLAKLYEHGANATTTRVVGTLGYLAPELTRTGKSTTASDVFAFGALALETVCARRPIEPKGPPEELVLVDLVWERWVSGLGMDALVDPRLKDDFVTEEAQVAIKVGLMCSHPNAATRPTMKEVVRYLDGDASLPDMSKPPEQAQEFGDGSVIAQNSVGYDNYLDHSYPSSSFEKASNVSSAAAAGRRLDSYSPLSLLSNDSS